MKKMIKFIGLVISFCLIIIAQPLQAKKYNQDWQQIPLTAPIEIQDPTGQSRTIQPSCSGAPVCTTNPDNGETECRTGDTDFSFFIRQGKLDRLLVFFDGGGACWDTNNCIYAPTFNQEVDETPDYMALLGGIADTSNRQNPLRDWTMVFIPYCTGDIHWGSNDQAYPDYLGVLAPVGTEFTVRHRGFDNFMAVKHWLENNYPKRRHGKKKKIKKLLVAGSSAGAYGALMAFPYFQASWPDSRSYLFSDAGNGVVTDNWLDAAITGDNPNWKTKTILPSWVNGMDSVFDMGAEYLAVNFYGAINHQYPDSAVAQYTTAWDATQVSFLHIMQNIDNPEIWQSPSPAAFCEWNYRMRQYAYHIASASNFRFYIGAGLNHTILGQQDVFTTETSAGVAFTDWLTAMLKYKPGEGNDDQDDDMDDKMVSWDNQECVLCQPPFDPALCGFTNF